MQAQAQPRSRWATTILPTRRGLVLSYIYSSSPISIFGRVQTNYCISCPGGLPVDYELMMRGAHPRGQAGQSGGRGVLGAAHTDNGPPGSTTGATYGRFVVVTD